MVKKKLFALVCVMTLTLGFASCKGKDVISDVAELQVSSTSLSFAAEGGTRSVTVTSSQDDWSAQVQGTAPWLTVRRQGEQLSLTAAPNMAPEPRTAEVSVRFKDLVRSIKVIQAGLAHYITLDPTEGRITSKGGEFVVNISTNAPAIEVKLAETYDWLTMEYDEANKRFTLKATENNELGVRVGKVYVTMAGSAPNEFVFTQEGEANIMPYLKMPVSLSEVVAYEEGRGHQKNTTNWGRFRLAFGLPIYEFTTGNTVFPAVMYGYTKEDSPFPNVIALRCVKPDVIDSEEYKKAVLDAGFEEFGKTPNDQIRYRHKTLPYIVEVTAREKDLAFIEYRYKPAQPQEFPTFASFPFADVLSFLSDPVNGVLGVDAEAVRAHERNLGSVVHTSSSDVRLLFNRLGTTDFYRVGYYLFEDIARLTDKKYVGRVHTIFMASRNLNLALWNSEGKYVVTQEALALFNANGFELSNSESNKTIFINEERKLMMTVSAVKPENSDAVLVLEVKSIGASILLR